MRRRVVHYRAGGAIKKVRESLRFNFCEDCHTFSMYVDTQ